MSSSLDFNNTSHIRNELLKRNLNVPVITGPVQQSVQSVVDSKGIDGRGNQDLLSNTLKNKFRPDTYETYTSSSTITLDLTKRGLYPLFTASDRTTLSTLLRGNGIMDSDSRMMQDSVKSLQRQFQERVRQGDRFNAQGFAITVDPNKGKPSLYDIIDGTSTPFPEIPGSYYRQVNDQTSLLGQIKDELGININRFIRPSETFVKYMGAGQRSILFDNLKYSKYRPNYGIGSPDAPIGRSYIGIDSPFDDISLLTNDFGGNVVRSAWHLTKAFDEFIGLQPDFDRTIDNDGDSTGGFIWKSRSINNKLGEGNAEWNKERSNVEAAMSTNYSYKDGTIMAKVQELLDTAPKGGAGRSHVGNAIDQTSRVFREGDKMISKGSAVKYVDKFSGTDSGIEFGRVWTKDKPFTHISDTMKKKGNLRNFKDSVLSSPYNLNIAPNNGYNNFQGSSNIEVSGRDFKAKKYMFSLENLAWKTSNRYGFRVDDLPYAERGPNGGRIMWFAPYDIKVSESNSGKWQDNAFLGRIEPIYTYVGAERTGTLSFKVVVDHPSIINVLARKHFGGMSDAESNNYIAAYFAGLVDHDLYDLTRKYTQLDKDDIQKILTYLNGSQGASEVYTRVKQIIGPQTEDISPVSNRGIISRIIEGNTNLYFANNDPGTAGTYSSSYSTFMATQSATVSAFTTAATSDGFASAKIASYVAAINQVYADATADNNKLNMIIEDIKSGLKIGNEIRVTLTGGAGLFETDQTAIATSRCNTIQNTILAALNIPDTGKKEYEVDYILDDGSTAKTKLIFVQIHKAAFYNDYRNGCDCNGSTLSINYGSNANLRNNNPTTLRCRTVEMEVRQTPANTFKVLGSTVTPGRVKTITETYSVEGAPVPQIDEVKRIMMKLFGEQYYFDALEESSPVVFASMKEKLKYFHPGFHSTTPEGLNARLTFLLQCTRPGDTIPIIKTDGEKSYNDARNTTFGPPPVCVLRIGDFYHSKVLLSDVAISYDDSPWDMNPEGIGFQPMIASVNISFKFIGGQGLKEPVSELQNALSSNFFANTEMYDYRSTPTEKKEEFNKEFLQNLVEQAGLVAKKAESEKPQSIQGNPIGKIKSWNVAASGQTTGVLDYTPLINDTLETMNAYNKTFASYFNNIYKKYGKTITSMILAETNRRRVLGTFAGTSVKIIGLHDTFGSQPDAMIKTLADDIGNLNFGAFQKIQSKLSDSEVAIFQTNYAMQYKDDLQGSIVDMIKSDFRNGEESLLTIQKKMVDSFDKLNLVDNKVDGTVNKGVVMEFILSATTSNIVQEYFTPHISKLNDLYTSVQDKLVNTTTATITEDPAYRPNILKSFFTAAKINSFMELFGDMGEQKKKKVREILTDYLDEKTTTVNEPKAINKINKTVEYAFSQNSSTPNAVTLNNIFTDKNVAAANLYNFSKMLK